MKQFITLLAFSSLCLFSQAQTWNFVGTNAGYAASEVDLDISPNGQLYMAYIDTDNGNRATVKKFVNGAWTLVGAAGISGTNSFDIQLVATSDANPAIAVKRLTLIGTINYEFLEMYRWSGTAWVSLSTGGYPHTYHNKDYSLRANATGTLFLTFWNRDYQTHDEGLITVNLSNQQQIGSIIDEWGTDFYGVSSYVGNGNDVKVAVCELADMDYASELRSYSGGSWDGPSLSYGEQMDDIKVEKGYATSNHCVLYKMSSPTTLKFRAVTSSDVLGTAFTIPTSGSVTEFDFDTYNDNAYVFYRNSTTCYFKQLTGTMAPTATTITSGLTLAPADATSLAAETYFGVHVIAYVSGGRCYVKEYNTAANIEDYDLFAMCEGTYFNNSGDPAVYCLDDNYDHSNMTMTCVTQNSAIIPQSAITVSGSGLYWYLTISNTNDVTANTVVDLLWTLSENGTAVGTLITSVTIYKNPTVTFNFPTTTVCENGGVVPLGGKASPGGGTWGGNGVSGNFFNPAMFNPSPATDSYITYSKTSAQGCTAKDSIQMTINQVPDLSLNIVDADCGETNGSASVTITGGSSPYHTYWSNGSSFVSVANLAPGQYFVNVTDNNGCSATGMAPVGSSGITLTGTTTDVQCNGFSSGTISLNVSGEDGPFTYAWSNGQTTEDIGFLPAGPYEVEVTDSEGCISTATFTIFEPAPITLGSTVVNAPSCEETDGSVTVNYTGGIPPFSYSWEDQNGTNIGGNSSTLSSIGAGYYTSTVTDDEGCFVSFPIMVSNANGPVIAIDTIINSSCAGDGSIELSNVSGNAQDFTWSNGATTQDISGIGSGTYIVQAAGSNACVTVLSAVVGSTQPEPVDICLLTVDTMTNTNLVVWEKPVVTGIDHFNIYRETSQAGLYQLAGQVDYDDESVYTDLVASPSVRSWRYKISSVDACGVESELSAYHKTIHLTVNLGLGTTINLSWDTYEGFTFPNFVVKRHTNANGWQTIQTMPTTLFTFTDTPPSTEGLVYLVTISSPSECNATKSAQDFNSSRSNKDSRLSVAVGTNSLNELLSSGMQLYPNPSNGTVTFENKAGAAVTATIFDASGRALKTLPVPPGSVQADFSMLASGMYQVVFTSGNAYATQKLTIQH